MKTDKDGFVVNVPKQDREKYVTTVEVTFDGKTLSVEPLPRVASLTTLAKLSASNNERDLENLRDRDAETYWTAALKGAESEILLEATFGKPETISGFYIARGEKWTARLNVELQVPDGNGGWRRITPKRLKLKIVPLKFLEKPVTTDRIRLRVTGTKRFTCAEFELYGPVGARECSR